LAAPYGNKNAEKWDSTEALNLFLSAIELTEETEEANVFGKKMTGYKFDFIGEIAAELGTFHEIFKHLTNRFPDLQLYKRQLDNNIERNCYSNVKRGFIKEGTGIVNLKSNWGWSDRQKIEHSGVSITIAVDKEAKKALDEITGE
jgi:hypothetical protein